MAGWRRCRAGRRLGAAPARRWSGIGPCLRMASASISICFWKSEGHAGAIIDALCSGLAIIATDWNSNSEFVTNNGILIKPMDSEALVNAIQAYIGSPNLAQKHGENSLIRAKDFHFNRVFPQYMKTLH